MSGPASMGHTVRPMSPSSNFTTYNLPARATGSAEEEYITPDPLQGMSTKPKGGRGRAMSAFLQLPNCSTHCFHHQKFSIDLDPEDSPILILHNVENHGSADGDSSAADRDGYAGEADSRLRTRMQAVLRHLEVRWQLFNEALSKFGDLDAMLAVCSENGRWRCYNRGTVQDAQLLDILQSLIDRKLSMEVFIETVTQLGPSGAMGFTINSYGSWTQLQPYDSAMANLALEVLQDIKTSRQTENCADIFSPSSQLQKQPCVLEEDWYTLCDHKVHIQLPSFFSTKRS